MIRFPTFREALSLAVLTLLAACGGSDAPAESADAPAEAAPADVAEAPAESAGLLDPNTADADALLAVPGMTEEIVTAVVAGRPWDDMVAVDAALSTWLDEAAREEAYRSVFVPLDLNEASEAEILLIPGVGDRMAHEFDEYRPYEAIERFRAEIGKYVDEDEVARLEQYVVIR